MAQVDQAKPLPEITDLTRPFWTGAKNRKLLMQKCPRCGTLNFYPKAWCVECGNRALEWVETKPTGTIYSYTIATAVMMNFPGWKDDLPVMLGIIDVDGGARMYGQMRVQVYFEDISEEAAIPKFRPA
jgi:uncharacterized OB-fold protein